MKTPNIGDSIQLCMQFIKHSNLHMHSVSLPCGLIVVKAILINKDKCIKPFLCSLSRILAMECRAYAFHVFGSIVATIGGPYYLNNRWFIELSYVAECDRKQNIGIL